MTDIQFNKKIKEINKEYNVDYLGTIMRGNRMFVMPINLFVELSELGLEDVKKYAIKHKK